MLENVHEGFNAHSKVYLSKVQNLPDLRVFYALRVYFNWPPVKVKVWKT